MEWKDSRLHLIPIRLLSHEYLPHFLTSEMIFLGSNPFVRFQRDFVRSNVISHRPLFDPDLCELGPELHWECMKSKSESWISITSPSHATTSFVISVSFRNRIKSSSNDSIYLKKGSMNVKTTDFSSKV